MGGGWLPYPSFQSWLLGCHRTAGLLHGGCQRCGCHPRFLPHPPLLLGFLRRLLLLLRLLLLRPLLRWLRHVLLLNL